MARLLPAAAGAVVALAAAAQPCVLVVHADGRPATGAIASCADGTLLGTVDGFGQLCSSVPCDTLVLRGPAVPYTRLAWSEALATGRLTLPTDHKALPPVSIAPWPSKRDRQALAAVSSPDSSALRGFEGSGLRNALLWVPGVQMDERGHGGSTRLSIRGSLLRAPYGVRGVKTYWGPFTLTLADGSTPLELLDPELVGQLDVVRSIGGPAYGAAPAGVLLADAPWRRTPGLTAEAKATVGSDGYFKLVGSVAVRPDSGSAFTAGVLRMGNDGYRQQEYSARDQVFLAGQWRAGRNFTRVLLTGQRASWGLPGSIDGELAARDPRAARPYSLGIDAHIEKTQVFAGLSNETALGHGLHIRCAVQAQAIDKLNPYGTTPALSGYKDEDIRGAGTRLALGGELEGQRLAFAWETGLELLVEKDALDERTYANGIVGDHRTDATARVGDLNGFVTTRTRIGARTTVLADIGMERTTFRLDDHLRASDIASDRPAAFYPLVGISHALPDGPTLQVRYAESRSRPTIWEALGTAGVFRIELAPERVQELEAGAAHQRGPWAATLNGYLRRTDGLILSRPTPDGEEFHNAGDAVQSGVEASVDRQLSLPGGHALRLLLNGAWQYHRLHLPERTDAVDVPGVPRWTTGTIVRLRMRQGTRLEVGYRTVSALPAGIPATTGPTIDLPGHGVLHARLEHAFRVGQDVLGLFVHLENVTDERYTSFVQLNDPGGRYYNPAPGRSVFGGAWYRFARGSRADGSRPHD